MPDSPALPPLTTGRLVRFWLPLCGTWLMMAVEGPFLAAIIARLPAAVENLAAFGVAFAFASIVESPVIMLLSASTALVNDRASYLALRRFTTGLNIVLTAGLAFLLVPPVYTAVSEGLLQLPAAVAERTYTAVALLLPWPAAIGYRRFNQGLLIRHDLTRWVAYGTAFRVSAMGLSGVLAARLLPLEGVEVGALGLSCGVVAEALVSRRMARPIVRRLSETTVTPPSSRSMRGIAAFYMPLAMTSVLAVGVQPMVTFFMGHSRFALQSLAVLPVINGLSFMFRSIGLSYQEATIALLAERAGHYDRLRRFAGRLAWLSSGGLALIAFSPLSTVWFQHISGLTPGLTAFALTPTRILTVLPALTVALALERAVLVHVGRTTPITGATALEVAGIGVALALGIGYLELPGAVAATSALVVGRAVATLSLVPLCLAAVRSLRPAGSAAA